eukprot:TRINITY_DN5468_c0_g1_i1.p1 TRINITY_DN5468_c0_g1~~TRINITY_DN5468_c0_g1_i1.p1  ORF type:complete len:432 (-),score=77.22 TRINITY_DN5468_c0_g1_i1:169-1464(-)
MEAQGAGSGSQQQSQVSLGIQLSVSEEQLRHGCFVLPLPFSQAHQPKLQGPAGVLAYLCNAKDNVSHIDQLAEESPASFNGDPDAFLESFKDRPTIYDALQRQMKNKVRKCPSCGKPVAFTLPTCNQCDHDLGSVPIGYTNNIFSSFVYGIARGPFPFTVSLRKQTTNTLVFDDLLALTSCHLNVVPTDCYLPDWRFLLKRPAEGRALAQRLFDSCYEGVLEPAFWANENWRKSVISPSQQDAHSSGSLRGHVAAGFNYPPSQYQLHLQFMLPPFLPFQYYMYLRGKHFTHGRFFPIEYVIEVLDNLIAAGGEGYVVNDDTPVEDIIAHFKARGVDYDAIHSKCYDRYGASHQLLSNYQKEDFEAIIIETGDTVFSLSNGALLGNTDVAKKAQADDKTTLQNYGRPYTKEGKPTGTYYRHAKDNPADLTVW